MANRFKIDAIFSMIDRVSAPVARIQNRVQRMTRKMRAGFAKLNRVVGKFSSGIGRAARTTAVGLASMTAGMSNVLFAGAGFEQAITNVGAVGLKTRAQIAPLEELALKLGRSTKFTATQAAGAMEILAKAGFKTNEILSATPAILSGAAASGMGIAETANHVSNVLKGMRLETSESARVVDVLTVASTKTNSTIGSLAESMKNVSSTAAQFKIPLEEVVAGVALLQDVGLDASVAGSAMNVMLTKMAAPTDSLRKKMSSLGITFEDANGNMLPFTEVLDQLQTGAGKAGGNMRQVAFLAELVGLRGQKAAANLADLFKKGRISELVEQLKAAKAKSDEMARLRMDTVSGSMLLLGSAVDAVKVKIFGMNNGPLNDVIKNMTKWASANEDLIASKVGGFLGDFIANLGSIVTWVKRIGIALAVFFAFVAVLKTLAGVLLLVNLIMLANPITLIVLGVLAAIAAFAVLVIWIDEISEGFDNMHPAVRALLAPLNLVIKAIKFIKDNFGEITEAVSSPVDFAAKQLARGGSNRAPFQQMVSPQDRTARSIEESKSTSSAEVTIFDKTGRAALTAGTLGPGLKLESSGAF